LYGDQYLGNHQLTERQHKALMTLLAAVRKPWDFMWINAIFAVIRNHLTIPAVTETVRNVRETNKSNGCRTV
jgi:hypothetical protein